MAIAVAADPDPSDPIHQGFPYCTLAQIAHAVMSVTKPTCSGPKRCASANHPTPSDEAVEFAVVMGTDQSIAQEVTAASGVFGTVPPPPRTRFPSGQVTPIPATGSVEATDRVADTIW